MTTTIETKTTTETSKLSDREYLADYIRKHGPIRCSRVSSAKSVRIRSGFSVSYYGVATYDVALNAKGRLILRCVSGAPTSRRSRRLAEEDAQEGRYPVIQDIGTLSDRDAFELRRWGELTMQLRGYERNTLLDAVDAARKALAEAEAALKSFEEEHYA